MQPICHQRKAINADAGFAKGSKQRIFKHGCNTAPAVSAAHFFAAPFLHKAAYRLPLHSQGGAAAQRRVHVFGVRFSYPGGWQDPSASQAWPAADQDAVSDANAHLTEMGWKERETTGFHI
jgi:hypothetical protein